MSEMKFEDIVFCGLEKEDRTGSKNSIDMSWLIQKLKAEYTVEKQTKDYYIVKSEKKRLHFIWRYNNKGDKAWTASDIPGEDLKTVESVQNLHLLVLIRNDNGKEEPEFLYSIQEKLTDKINGKDENGRIRKISSGSFDTDYNEESAKNKQVLMQVVFERIVEKMKS